MKNKIDDLMKKQINFIIDAGQNTLLSPDYLSFILENYDYIVSTLNETENVDKHIANSLSILVSRLK